MKKVLLLAIAMDALSSCATYKGRYPEPGEQVFPGDVQPMPTDGVASAIRDVIRK